MGNLTDKCCNYRSDVNAIKHVNKSNYIVASAPKEISRQQSPTNYSDKDFQGLF